MFFDHQVAPYHPPFLLLPPPPSPHPPSLPFFFVEGGRCFLARPLSLSLFLSLSVGRSLTPRSAATLLVPHGFPPPRRRPSPPPWRRHRHHCPRASFCTKHLRPRPRRRRTQQRCPPPRLWRRRNRRRPPRAAPAVARRSMRTWALRIKG
jgi:hypothetical protein